MKQSRGEWTYLLHVIWCLQCGLSSFCATRWKMSSLSKSSTWPAPSHSGPDAASEWFSRAAPWRKPRICERIRLCMIVQRASQSTNRYKWCTQWICAKAFLDSAAISFSNRSWGSKSMPTLSTSLKWGNLSSHREIRRFGQFKCVFIASLALYKNLASDH